MFLTYLILAVALSLSAVAAFYSIIGLTVIFAAAAVPVIVMGSILEIAKLVVTVWLHEHWHQIKLSMKLYLVPAVLLLMFITSMGIFGFLSKAHIEQTAAGTESQAQVERIGKEISRQTDIINRAELRFTQLQTSGLGADANVQQQINTEQQRIDTAYQRVQVSIDEQNRTIENQTRLYTEQIDRIDQELSTLQGYINSGDVAKAQSMIGSRSDGQWGPATATALRNWQTTRNQARQALVQQLKDLDASNATVSAARAEIQRLRQGAELQVAESNRLINRLREQLGKSNAGDVEAALQEQQAIIGAANKEMDLLTQQRYQLEIEFRKFEAEVGPIKYIAEFVYSEQADKNMLEKSVRWVIVIIVAVFDPLAVMMLLAFTESRSWERAAQSAATTSTPTQPVQPAGLKNSPTVIRRRSDPNFTVPVLVEPDSADGVDPTEPDEILEHIDGVSAVTIAFGQAWPDNPVKGYMFLRTDYAPTKLFKYNGQKWIEVDKELTDGYITNDAYITFLMRKVELGEYDPELLNDAELSEIESRLQGKGNQ